MVPLIQIVFFIAVNIIPPDQDAFAIATPQGQVYAFAKQDGGGWKPSPVPEGGSGVWSVEGDMLKIMRTDGGSGLKMSQFFADLDKTDWSTVTELMEGKTPIKVIRKQSEVVVVRGTPPKDDKYIIKW